MPEPPPLHQILGTAAGDRFLSNPKSANDLYKSLVGSPGLDSLQQSLAGNDMHHTVDDLPYLARPRPLLTEKDLEPSKPPGPVFVESYRDTALFISRESETPGVGYPSCSRALAKVAKSMHDPNGYYRRIGVHPDATEDQIRTAFRRKYRRCHPDGWAPDAEEFDYLREISAVLTNPERRRRYDNLAPGEKWLDSRVAAELDMNEPIVMEFIQKCDEEQRRMEGGGKFKRVRGPETFKEGGVGDGGVFRGDRQKAMFDADRETGNDFYDWFSDGERIGDKICAQLWYYHLVAVAPIFGYKRSIRVCLAEDAKPSWSNFGGILRIPRTWNIGRAEAFALFSVVVCSASRESPNPRSPR